MLSSKDFTVSSDKLVIERLTALWALNECGLGGFMHAVSSPFTGIFVGGIAILLITLIAMHSKNVWASLVRALSIVLLVKLSVSPHSPITSYVAVSFQAFLGMVLFSLLKVNRISILLLGIVTFLESALQKLLMLTILYGESLWEAIDIYGGWIGQKIPALESVFSSKSLIWTYVGLYGVAGMVAGILIFRIIKLTHSIELETNGTYSMTASTEGSIKRTFMPSKKVLFFWGVALILILVPIVFFNSEFDGWRAGIYIVARSALILILWYTVIGPLLLRGLNLLLARKESAYREEIQNTLVLFPYLRTILKHAWIDSSSKKGMMRVQHFLARSIVYSVNFSPVSQ